MIDKKESAFLVKPEDEELIKKALKEKPYTAVELNEAMSAQGTRCPDDMARILSQMRKKGYIYGQFSEEKSAWVYWADKG